MISQKVRYGEREFTSIRFSFNGSDVPAIRVDGSFRLFDFNSNGKVTYSLVIKCGNNEDLFQKLCRVLSRESSKITNEKQNFGLVKETTSGSKVVSLNSIKNLISIENLVDESSTGSCILKLYQCYIGEPNSISLAVQEIFAKRLEGIESYLDDESETESESDNE